MIQKVVELFARQNIGAWINLFVLICIFNNRFMIWSVFVHIDVERNAVDGNAMKSKCAHWLPPNESDRTRVCFSSVSFRSIPLHFHPSDHLHFSLTIAQPGRYSSLVGSSRRSSSFITISHTACERVGQFCKLPWQRWGILKYIVYGQSGGFDNGAVMVESYKNACSSIIVNWLLPPTRKYGARTPTTALSVMFAYFSMMILMPPISLAQSSTVAFDQKRSSSLCLHLSHSKWLMHIIRIWRGKKR